MSFLLALWWLGASPTPVTVPVLLPPGETAEDWRHALSLCVLYRLTPSAAAPSDGPMVQIQASGAGWKITVRDERGEMKHNTMSRAGRDRPHDDAATWACSLLRPTSDAASDIPLPPEQTPKPSPAPIGPRKKRSSMIVKPTPPPTPPAPAPVVLVADARALAPGEQLDGLMPVGAAGVCTCSWITDDSDLRSDDARWSFAPDCGTCEPTPPLEIREVEVDRRGRGIR